MRGSSQLTHLDAAETDILEPQIACELEKSMDELKSEKAQYEKYGAHLQNEITTLFDKNEKLLSCLNTRQITLNDLGGRYEQLERALAEQTAIKERLMKIQQKLKELRRKKDTDDPKKVLNPLIQLSERECEAKERELDEIRWIMKRMIDTMNEFNELKQRKEKAIAKNAELTKEVDELMTELGKKGGVSGELETILFKLQNKMSIIEQLRADLFRLRRSETIGNAVDEKGHGIVAVVEMYQEKECDERIKEFYARMYDKRISEVENAEMGDKKQAEDGEKEANNPEDAEKKEADGTQNEENKEKEGQPEVQDGEAANQGTDEKGGEGNNTESKGNNEGEDQDRQNNRESGETNKPEEEHDKNAENAKTEEEQREKDETKASDEEKREKDETKASDEEQREKDDAKASDEEKREKDDAKKAEETDATKQTEEKGEKENDNETKQAEDHQKSENNDDVKSNEGKQEETSVQDAKTTSDKDEAKDGETENKQDTEEKKDNDEYEYYYEEEDDNEKQSKENEKEKRGAGFSLKQTDRTADAVTSMVTLVKVEKPVEPREKTSHFRRNIPKPPSLDAEIRQVKEKLNKVSSENELLRMQLLLARRREKSTEPATDIDALEEKLNAMEQEGAGVLDELEQQFQADERLLSERKSALAELQKENARKCGALRRLNQTLQSMGADGEWLSAISKEQLTKLTELNEAIIQARRRYQDIDARIKDLKNIIDMNQRRMLVKTQTPKPDVIQKCERLRTRRFMERENLRFIAMNEAEMRFTDKLIEGAKQNYGHERVELLKAENNQIRNRCKRLKRKFYDSRATPDRSRITLTTEAILESMQTMAFETFQTIDSEKKQQITVYSKIDRQMKLLREYNIDIPPPPQCYQRPLNLRVSQTSF